MSSILDALRKVEEERSMANEPVVHDIDANAAQDELVGGSSRLSLSFNTPTLVIGTVLLIGIVVAASVTTALILVRASTPQPQVATAPAEPVVTTKPATGPPTSPEPADPVTAEPAPANQADAPPNEAPEKAATSESAVTDNPQAPLETAPANPDAEEVQAAFAAQPAQRVVERNTPAPAETPPPNPPPRTETAPPIEDIAPPEPRVMAGPKRQESLDPLSAPSTLNLSPETPDNQPQDDAPRSINILPRLSTAIQNQYQLTDKRVNMPRPHTEPRKSAVIDMEVVYVGDRVPGTNARLIGVDGRGVAIEIIGTGERYYWPM